MHEQVSSAGALMKIDVRGARLLVISAHGDPFALFLGGDRTRTLDARDREQLHTFFANLAPDATIILQSCEAGRGIAWVVKEAAGEGRHVIAAKGVIPPDGLAITSLEPVDAKITCRDERGRLWDCTVRL